MAAVGWTRRTIRWPRVRGDDVVQVLVACVRSCGGWDTADAAARGTARGAVSCGVLRGTRRSARAPARRFRHSRRGGYFTTSSRASTAWAISSNMGSLDYTIDRQTASANSDVDGPFRRGSACVHALACGASRGRAPAITRDAAAPFVDVVQHQHRGQAAGPWGWRLFWPAIVGRAAVHRFEHADVRAQIRRADHGRVRRPSPRTGPRRCRHRGWAGP